MDNDIKDREDELFEQKLAQKNHKELMEVLEKVVSNLSQDSDKEELGEMREQTAAIKELVASLKEPEEKDEKGINITVDNKEIVTSLQAILGEFTDVVGRLEKAINTPKQKCEWEFDFKRNQAGFIQSPIKITQK